ncbi:MAG TPA: FliH/SctL family protein [Acidimicrobiales bacterium]|nr:FliH/SctL family protein [Acidimicrobiales bacterium]
MSELQFPDPLTTPTRELRRFAHATPVPMTYASHDADVEAARARGLELTQQGYDEGFAQGLAAARSEAERMRREESERVAGLVGALELAIAEVRALDANLRVELQLAAPRLAFALVEELVAHELAASTNPGRDAIVRALALDEGTLAATVRMNPSDRERLGETSQLGLEREIAVVSDPAVDSGGVLVEIGDTMLDGRLDAALARVKKVLLGTPCERVGDDWAA